MAAEEDSSDPLRTFINNLFNDESFNVKEKQLQVIDSILKGKDTVGILPTGNGYGYGKSLIYRQDSLVTKALSPL